MSTQIFGEIEEFPENGEYDSIHSFAGTTQLLQPENQSLLLMMSPLKEGAKVSRSSIEMLSILADAAREEQEKMSNLILKLKTEEPVPAPVSKFRNRRLTYGDEPIFSPVKGSAPVASKPQQNYQTTFYASSELGATLKGKIEPPFPSHVLGTFSCHGIEPCPDDYPLGDGGYDGEDVFGSVGEGISQKINQDRGCVVYPYHRSNEEALFMVLDGHGPQGDLVAEFVMRQIVVSLEKDPELQTNPSSALKTAYLTTNTALLLTTLQFMSSGCTCVSIYVQKTQLFIAHVGDSRAVLAFEDEHGAIVVKNLTKVCGKSWSPLLSQSLRIRYDWRYQDHKPDDPFEHDRIVSWGGFVRPAAEVGLSARVYLDPEFKMMGLAMSRSLGFARYNQKNAPTLPLPLPLPRSGLQEIMP